MAFVYGMGNPLMDIILSAGHEKVIELGVTPGSMNLVEFEVQKRVIGSCRLTSRLAGGSCSNTMRALGWLAGGEEKIEPPVYSGAVGKDEYGRAFEESLRAEGVTPALAWKETPTGSSAIIVTPDHERTMFTFLGACRDLTHTDVDTSSLAGCTVFHTTGYMWDTENQEDAVKTAIMAVRDRGGLVSFDIADPFVVDRYRADLVKWLPGRIDVLFANEQELMALTGVTSNREAIVREAKRFAPMVVMKIGREGCMIGEEGSIATVPGEAVAAQDTTGAGDSFAGGFLYGLVLGKDAAACGRLANRIAGYIVTVDGCHYRGLDRQTVLAALG